MRKANTQIVPQIKQKTLELLMHNTPEQIGMRDIARACGITATSIYHYYKDKNKLFQDISLDCIYDLNERISKAVQSNNDDIQKQIKKAIETFRDWCFENPRRALLVMQDIQSATDAEPDVMEQYYVCNRTGESLLKQAISMGKAKSDDPRLDVGILISSIWGCVEAIITKRTEVAYWDNGKAFTDRAIALWMQQIFIEN
ncbi:MAG: TetR/AcrR family transcriptional regulator [Treponema sp.]|nr:TetR/AcrR family transcriptional regulator [Treponema sp.]